MSQKVEEIALRVIIFFCAFFALLLIMKPRKSVMHILYDNGFSGIKSRATPTAMAAHGRPGVSEKGAESEIDKLK